MPPQAAKICASLITCLLHLRAGIPACALWAAVPSVFLVAALIFSRRALSRMRADMHRLQHELQEAAARHTSSERANVAKGEFLASMSAEMQAPMNGIVSFSQMALKGDLPPPQRGYMERVLDSAEWMMRVLSDVLDFSRLEAQQLQLEESDFSFSACVLSALKAVQPAALRKHLDLRSKIDSTIPPLLRGDPARVRQVILNLLEHAVRFTTSGSIVLSASMVERNADLTTLAVTVADTGIGIPSDEQSVIFEPFTGGKRVSLDRDSGTGLELSICKHLVEIMGGAIEAQTHVGAGSTFRFSVRLANPILMLQDGDDGEILNKLTSKRISLLVADENAANRRLIAKVFESAGHQVVQVGNGKQALDTFCTDIFDVVFLSPMLPDLGAGELIHELRGAEAEASRTRIYCFRPTGVDTALPSSDPIDGYVTKPADVEELLTLLNQMTANRGLVQYSRQMAEV